MLIIPVIYFAFIYLFNFINCDVLIIDRIPISELFTTKIEPKIFNWTFQGVTEQFIYRPSLKGYPDLPSWLRYMYSTEYHAGFLYGTPPENLANKEVYLDIVGLNKQNYETREIILKLNIIQNNPANNLIQMKIDNLNWVHLMDPGRVENLKNIFQKDLWPSSENDLHLVFMESAVKMGGRIPLRPQQREGVIVHLGSNVPFSDRLKELQEEIRPLYKLPTCTYKRTSVQKLFENVGFKLDWCSFRLIGDGIENTVSSAPEILYHNHGIKNSITNDLKRVERWYGMHKNEAPVRNYIDEFAFAFAIPGMIFAVLIGILSAVLCFHHKKLCDDYSERFFQNIFHICEDYYCPRNNTQSATVQMVQCTDTSNQPTTTLRSLNDPNLLIDNISLHSDSPANTGGNNYLRPPPPTYKPPSIGQICVDI